MIGLGGLGHLGVLYPKAMGARVAVLYGSPDKEDEAKELGAERFIYEEGMALSGSPKDIRGTPQFAATHDVRPQITKRPLEGAADVLNEMHERRLRGCGVLTMA